METKILIADDHPTLRDGLKQLLQVHMPGAEISTVATGHEALQLLLNARYTLLILDLDMAGKSGLEVLRALKDAGAETRVLVFSMHAETDMGMRALKLGAFGYLNKAADMSEIITAVNTVMQGRKHIPPALAEQMSNQLEKPTDKAPHELLSEREYQVLLLLAQGKTVSQIAKELELSVPTISTFRSRILVKMGLKTTAAAVQYAIKNNLV